MLWLKRGNSLFDENKIRAVINIGKDAKAKEACIRKQSFKPSAESLPRMLYSQQQSTTHFEQYKNITPMLQGRGTEPEGVSPGGMMMSYMRRGGGSRSKENTRSRRPSRFCPST